jgi:hypothetical protein
MWISSITLHFRVSVAHRPANPPPLSAWQAELQCEAQTSQVGVTESKQSNVQVCVMSSVWICTNISGYQTGLEISLDTFSVMMALQSPMTLLQ